MSYRFYTLTDTSVCNHTQGQNTVPFPLREVSYNFTSISKAITIDVSLFSLLVNTEILSKTTKVKSRIYAVLCQVFCRHPIIRVVKTTINGANIDTK